MFSAGATIGRYRLQRPLGRGATGQVWQAVLLGPHGFRKPVALKLVPGPSSSRAAQLREARFGALLHHPNVVTTYEIGEHDDGTLFIAMELVVGPAVSAWVREAEAPAPLPPRVVLDIGMQACAGLEHIHGLATEATPNGLVHGDIKPANLLVDLDSAQLKIADLGISALAGDASSRSGTPGYVAPERIAGDPTDGRADLFALGATLAYLATGRRPLGTGAAGLAAAMNAETVVRRSRLLERVDGAVPGLGPIVERCLRTAPSDRWSSAGELGEALARERWAPRDGATLPLTRLGVASLRDHAAAWPRAAPPTELEEAPAVPDRPTVGRDRELAELRDRVGRHRLVTVLGLGGVGKTTLARLLLGAEDRWPGWFVDLSEAHAPAAACFAVARALGVELGADDPVPQVGAALQARGPALLVLDNLEQLVDHAQDTVGAWLSAAPELRVLATSRAPLQLADEDRLPLGGLPRDAALELFHARAPRPVSPADQRHVVALIDVLDGLPLGIEIAAASSARIPLAELRERLGEADPDPQRPRRHHSLEASLEASWGLLTPWARATLAQLCVFDGGFSLEAAASVVQLAGPSVVDALQELVDASLLRVEPVPGRFSVPAVVAVHAAGRAPDRAAAEVRHGAFFAQFGSPGAVRSLDTRGGPARFRRLADEVDNLAAAARRAVARRDGDAAAGCALALEAVFARQGPVSAALPHLEGAVALGRRAPELWVALGRTLGECDRDAEAVELLTAALGDVRDPRSASKMRHALGAIHLRQERRDAAEHLLGQALEGFRALGDAWWQAVALRELGIVCWQLGRLDEARERYEWAHQLAREVGSRRLEAMVVENLALVSTEQGRLAEAEQWHREALVALRECGARRQEAKAMGNLALTLHFAGRLREALEWYRIGLPLHRAAGDRRFEAAMLSNLANVLGSVGRTGEAVAAFESAIAIHRELSDRRFEGIALGNLASTVWDAGDLERALALLEEALAIHRAIGNRRFEAVALGNRGGVRTDVGRLGEARADLEQAYAIAASLGDRNQEALWSGCLGLVDALEGRAEVARQRLADACAALEAIGGRAILLYVLARRAEAERVLGDPDAAERVCAHAEALANELGWDTSAPLLRRMRRPARALAPAPH